MSEKPNEAQRIAGDLRSWIQQPEHGPLMWMRDAIPPRRVAEFADRIESLGESGECEACGNDVPTDGAFRVCGPCRVELANARTDAPGEVWAVMEHGLSIVYEIHLSEESAAAGAARLTGKMRIKKYPVHGSTQDAGEVRGDASPVGCCCECGDKGHVWLRCSVCEDAVMELHKDCDECDRPEQWEALNEKVQRLRTTLARERKQSDAKYQRRIGLCDDLDTANKRIEELEAERRTWVTMAYHEEALDRVKADLQRLREGIREIEEKLKTPLGGMVKCADVHDWTRALLDAQQEGEKHKDCVHVEGQCWAHYGPIEKKMPLPPEPCDLCNDVIHRPGYCTKCGLGTEGHRPKGEPSDALARAREAMSRLSHETTTLGRINHVASAIGAMLDHLEDRGKCSIVPIEREGIPGCTHAGQWRWCYDCARGAHLPATDTANRED